MQELGERPNAWVLSPQDAQALDLTRWGTSGGLLTGGFQNDSNVLGFGSSDNIFGDISQRIVSKSVPQGTALLAELDHGTDLFTGARGLTSTPRGRCFKPTRSSFEAKPRSASRSCAPQAFAVVDLTSGS